MGRYTDIAAEAVDDLARREEWNAAQRVSDRGSIAFEVTLSGRSLDRLARHVGHSAFLSILDPERPAPWSTEDAMVELLTHDSCCIDTLDADSTEVKEKGNG